VVWYSIGVEAYSIPVTLMRGTQNIQNLETLEAKEKIRRGIWVSLPQGTYSLLFDNSGAWAERKIWYQFVRTASRHNPPCAHDKAAHAAARRVCFWCDSAGLDGPQHNEGKPPWFGRGPGHRAPREWAGMGKEIVVKQGPRLAAS